MSGTDENIYGVTFMRRNLLTQHTNLRINEEYEWKNSCTRDTKYIQLACIHKTKEAREPKSELDLSERIAILMRVFNIVS